MLRAAISRLILLVAIVCGATAAEAGGRPGGFDFYVLSLSWSPTYCLDNSAIAPIQCGGRPFAFVVHGFWPQYERGYPSDCPTDRPNVPRRDVDAMLDLMPSRGLIRHEWQTHGSCSGLDQADYFALIRSAWGRVTIPPRYVDVTTQLTVDPAAVEDAFVRANPGLSKAAVSVVCDRKRLKEVRICMTKDLAFRPCPDVDRNACRQASVVMPPVR